MTWISIIIVTFNSKEVIADCLGSIHDGVRQLPGDTRVEVLIVDNNSRDGTQAYLLDHLWEYKGLNIDLRFNEKNLGLSQATNQAYSYSRGDFIMLTNPDVVFNRGLVRFLEYGTGIHSDSVIGPSLLNMDGTEQRAIHSRVTGLPRMFFCFGLLGHFFDKYLMRGWFRKYYSYLGEKMGGHYPVFQLGTCIMLSRKTIEKLQGFPYDERLPLYFGDVDLAMRARQAGVECLVITDVAFKHVRGHSLKNENPYVQRFTFSRDMAGFAKIYGPPLWILRGLFMLDAIVSFPLIVVARARRPHTWSGVIRYSAEQVRGILS